MSSARKRSAVLRAKSEADLAGQKAILAEDFAMKCKALTEIAIGQRNEAIRAREEAVKALGEIVLHIAPYRYTNADMHRAITKCIDRAMEAMNPVGENDVEAGNSTARPEDRGTSLPNVRAGGPTVVTAGETAPNSKPLEGTN